MGHYDDCYEATARMEERNLRNDLIRWISELDFDSMSTEELTLLYHVAEHIEDFTSMQRFLRNLNGL
jgi:hypothetical protein